ncbi:ChaN family lipoprotein [Ideonella sp. DXS29W]|uniref:ChaN family lipoprotein n=1 Tax=Ideonella lacteola TaxID=2984193 RepID=A0ABU9BLK7_9BURK
MKRLLPLIVTLFGALATLGCAHPDAPPPPGLAQPRFVLLGEVHDNPRHHTLRAEWLRALLADGRPTRVVFEQLDATKDGALQAARQDHPRDSDAVARAGGLDEKGWRWPLHRPLFDVALAAGATITGGNLPRESIRAVVRQGEVPGPLQALIDRSGWSPTLQAAAEADIVDGHCGALPASQVAPMALAQRVRDASMAQAMLASAPGERVVLIAGNGHVRRDRGVPHYLRGAGVAATDIIAVGLVEIDGMDAPASAFDRLQATEREPRPDPCEAFKTSR